MPVTYEEVGVETVSEDDFIITNVVKEEEIVEEE